MIIYEFGPPVLLTYTRGSGQTDGDVGKMLAERISYCRLIIKRPGNVERKGFPRRNSGDRCAGRLIVENRL